MIRIKKSTNKAEPICVPFTKSGEMAFDVIREVAIKVHAKAADKISEFIDANFPENKTISITHENGKYCRTIRAKGATQTVTYDYRTKEIELLN